MTLYGWDASHFDGIPSKAQLAKALSEGLSFVSHKLGEGLTNNDGTDASFLANARDVGFELIGGYWFCHGEDSVAAEVRAAVSHAKRVEPWWLEFAGAYWQADCERSTSLPSPTWVKQFCDGLEAETGLKVICYASRGQYGNSLQGLGHPLWNASYGLNKAGGFKSIYPGDSFMGWLSYSGQIPTLLQYGSRATIAGLSTCDANAYRGTLEQLKAVLAPRSLTVAIDTTDVAAIVQGLCHGVKMFVPKLDASGKPVVPTEYTLTLSGYLDAIMAAAKADTGGSVPTTMDVTLTGTATPVAG